MALKGAPNQDRKLTLTAWIETLDEEDREIVLGYLHDDGTYTARSIVEFLKDNGYVCTPSAIHQWRSRNR